MIEYYLCIPKPRSRIIFVNEPRKIELLAPAKNADYGIEAILHGADAVYIGAPMFGARASAGNTVSDIERLSEFAHRYHARVYVAMNTILEDKDLADAERLLHELYNAGTDAVIIQDMGILQLQPSFWSRRGSRR